MPKIADEEILTPANVTAVAQAALEALGCRAVVIVAIGEDSARTAVARRSVDYAVESALTCAAGSLALALRFGGGKQIDVNNRHDKEG